MEADLETIKENWWDKYLEECEATKTRPTMKDFIVYLEEQEVVQDYEED